MDELRFYLKHLVKKYKLSQPAEDDAVFQGTNVKYAGRKKERHGYEAGQMPGNDREVYEDTVEEGFGKSTKKTVSPQNLRQKKREEMKKKQSVAEGEVVSMKHNYKKGDVVNHEGRPHRVLDVIAPGTKQTNSKGETVTTKHAVLRLDRGKKSWPKDVPAHKVSKWNMNEQKSLTDVLQVEKLDEIFKGTD
jgi:hypothetical protein